MPTEDRATPTLLQRIAAGEADAVDACIERYTRLVWSLARSLSPDPGTVEDVVQEIFIDVWKSAERYDPSKASEATFITTIARRRVIDRRRRSGRRPESDAELVEDDSATVEDGTQERLELEEEAGLAMAAMEQLEPRKREVLMMSIVEGLTHTQIAKRTGMPLGTVKSHARRGLMKVAELLRGPQDEEAAP